MHVYEVRCEVLHGLAGAVEAGVDHEHEQRHTDRAAQRIDPCGDTEQRTLACALEPGFGPQRRERDEGDDEHHRGSPPEQPGRDREIGAAHQPVRQSGGGPERRGRGRQRQGNRYPTFHGSTLSEASAMTAGGSTITPPVGKSGPGMYFKSVRLLAFGVSIR